MEFPGFNGYGVAPLFNGPILNSLTEQIIQRPELIIGSVGNLQSREVVVIPVSQEIYDSLVQRVFDFYKTSLLDPIEQTNLYTRASNTICHMFKSLKESKQPELSSQKMIYIKKDKDDFFSYYFNSNDATFFLRKRARDLESMNKNFCKKNSQALQIDMHTDALDVRIVDCRKITLPYFSNDPQSSSEKLTNYLHLKEQAAHEIFNSSKHSSFLQMFGNCHHFGNKNFHYVSFFEQGNGTLESFLDGLSDGERSKNKKTIAKQLLECISRVTDIDTASKHVFRDVRLNSFTVFLYKNNSQTIDKIKINKFENVISEAVSGKNWGAYSEDLSFWSPEAVLGIFFNKNDLVEQLGVKEDCWGLGVILYQLYFKKPVPWQKALKDIENAVRQRPRVSEIEAEQYDKKFYDLGVTFSNKIQEFWENISKATGDDPMDLFIFRLLAPAYKRPTTEVAKMMLEMIK